MKGKLHDTEGSNPRLQSVATPWLNTISLGVATDCRPALIGRHTMSCQPIQGVEPSADWLATQLGAGSAFDGLNNALPQMVHFFFIQAAL